MADPETQSDASTVTRWHHAIPSGIDVRRAESVANFPRWFFHPTHARLSPRSDQPQSQPQPQSSEWTSRNHRKHRYVSHHPGSSASTKRCGPSPLARLANLRHMEYWNVSWWVAVSFTLGSIIWTINGFASFLPFCDSARFQTASESQGWTAFLGATVFAVGSWFGMWEAWNRGDVGDFGEEVRMMMHHDDSGEEKRENPKWIWFTADPKFFREPGFLAAFFQLCAANIFWISGFTAIPTLQSSISTNTPLLVGTFWVPQIIGGFGFVLSASFILLESQRRWYIPQPLSLGWHVGFWNLIGGMGFALCGVFGLGEVGRTWEGYESSACTFWGSWAFLIGSVVQWYESVNPVA